MDRIKVVIVDSGLREELIFKENPDCVAVSDIENNSVMTAHPHRTDMERRFIR